LNSEPSNNGQWKPEDVLFYPPDESPADDCNTLGKWALGDNEEWPPASDGPKKPQRSHSPHYVGARGRQPAEDIPEEIRGVPGKLPPWQTDDDWKDGKAVVYPKGQAPKDNNDNVSRGTWRSKDTLPDDWIPQEVIIYPQHAAPSDDTPNGVWGTDPTSKPDENGQYKPKDVVFYPPSETPDEEVTPRGKWALGEKKKWPPPTESPKQPRRTFSPYMPRESDTKNQPEMVGTIPLNDDDDWVPIKALVFSRQKAPDENKADEEPKGVWKSKDPLPDDWIPKEVIIYPKDAKIDEDTPNGVWGTNLNSEPSNNGQWKPEDVLFYPPDESPADDCNTLGKWALGDNEEWPPASDGPKKPQRSHSPHYVGARGRQPAEDIPEEIRGVPGKLPPWQTDDDWKDGKAVVYPKGQAPKDNNDNVSRGTWRSKDTLPDDWIPQEVIIYPQHAAPSDDTPNGVWGTDPTSKPDENGQYKPKDVVFYPPSETPDEEVVPRGRWELGEKKKWPPPSESPKKPHRVSSLKGQKAPMKLPVWQDQDDWVPVKAIVFPKKEAPKENQDDISRGVWKSKDPLPEDMVPSEVIIHPKKAQIDEDAPNGVWGTNSFSTPDQNGQWKPEDVVFYPPSEKPDEDCTPRGRWELGEETPSWPPTAKGPQQPHRADSPKTSQPSILEDNWDTLPAVVIPASDEEANKTSEDPTDPHLGTWKPNKETDDEDLAPFEVLVSKSEPDDLAEDEPNGIVAVPKGAEPNDAGKLDPKDLLFLPPGEKPDSGMKEVGHWRPKKWNGDWPPPKKDVSKAHLPTKKLPSWQTDSDWIKGRAVVFPKDIAPKKNEDNVTRGGWQTDKPLSEEPFADLFEPQEVAIQPAGAEQEGEAPNGLWGTNASSEPDENGQWKPEDVLFYPPSKKPGDECIPRGRWSLIGPAPEFLVAPKPDSSILRHKKEWTPVSPTTPTSSRNVGKLKMPNVFGAPISPGSPGRPKPVSKLKSILDDDWKTLPAKVVPASAANDAVPDATDPVIGVWKPKDDTDDSNWAPLAVTVEKEEPKDLAPDEPHGIVGIKEDAKPTASGKLKPNEVVFYPPGEEPEPGDDVKKVGTWRGGKLNTEWPPATVEKEPADRKAKSKDAVPSVVDDNWDSLPAVVIPASDEDAENAPEDATDPHLGTWKQNDDTDDKDWGPLDVVINKNEPDDFAPDEPHGIVAVPEDAKPNAVGKLDPKDMQFVAQGEKPGSGMKEVGHWRPKAWNGEWPPKKKNGDRSKLPTKKLPNWQTDSDWIKDKAFIFPPDKAPKKNEDNVSKGIWKTDEPLPAGLEPQEVVIQPVGAELEDENKRNGVWGTSADSVTDENGQYKPEDVLFYPPSKEPGDECKPRGRWSLVGPAPESLRSPPKKPNRLVSPLAPKKDEYKSPRGPGKAGWKGTEEAKPTTAKRVGKLKVPMLFGQKPDTDAPISPGRSPGRRSAGRPRRVSKFNKQTSWVNRGKSILDDDWSTLPATVVPKSTAEDVVPDVTDPVIGVWKQPDDATDDSDWAPLDVIVSKEEPKDFAPNEPHGVVGVKDDAKPTTGGKLKPKEVVFYPPGEEPEKDVKKVGTWRTGKLNSPWPPAKVDKAAVPVSRGKLKTQAISEEPEGTGIKVPKKDKEAESKKSEDVATKAAEPKPDEAADSKPAAEKPVIKPRPIASTRASTGTTPTTTVKPKPKPKPFRSPSVAQIPKQEPKHPPTPKKRVGKLKLPAAFSGK